MGLLDNMIAQPGSALVLALIFWLVSFIELRFMLSELLRMHKSKTAVKKIGKQYTFWQKLTLRHIAEHTEHAVGFTRFMILVHHLSCCAMILCLLSRLILSDRWFVYLLAVRCLIFDFPVFILNVLLDAYPFQKRKHAYRFTKYHNTADKTSLF